jgi:glyoxalase/bleomycin resistance protein/dioxygenase superfamily protein
VAFLERAKSNGAEIVAEPSDQYWGDRCYEAKDHEGHLWFFHEHLRDVSREKIKAIEANVNKLTLITPTLLPALTNC